MEGQRRGFILVFLVSFLLTQVLCQKTPSSPQVTCPAGHLKSWTHDKPGDWGRLCPAYSTCATGNRQSPINIALTATSTPPASLTVRLGWSPVNLIRVGKYVTMPIAFGTGYPDAAESLTWNGKRWFLNRLEFHSPSEHTINGKYANLEVQLYFSSADNKPASQVAISLLFNRGVCSDDAFFSALIPALPRRDRCECGNNRTENFFPFNEQCDLGAANAYTADKCRPNCVLPFCGDGIRDSGEECDVGNVTRTEPNKCRPGCITPKCGDGVLDSAAPFFEECDDGNRLELDGCSGTCKKECGDGCWNPLLEECDLGRLNTNISGVFTPAKNVCRTDCKWARCGDGIVDIGEACDDGFNTNRPNGCRANCTLPFCGDGVVDSRFNETCDPPNTPTCNANCRFRCGDGIVERPAEECDNGTLNSNASGACRPNCTLPFCGDGIVDPNEQCDFLNNPLCFNNCTWRCGNRQIESDEQCDNGHPAIYPARANDGNSDTRPNACRMNCRLFSCGDGVIDNLGCEQCDNGRNNNDSLPNACRTNCRSASCGDGVVDNGEECDDKNNIDDDGCSCCRKDCGNGIKQGNEECDDGAANSDAVPDRCRSNCKRHFCGDGLTDSDEECDWANKKSIGCTRQCTRPFCGDGITHFTLGEECDAGANNSYTKINGCSPICTLNVCGQTLTTNRVNLQTLVNPTPSGYYTYAGSETRPPCTENVQWFVSTRIRTISNSQFIQFTDVLFKNNRPLQGLNGRNPLASPLTTGFMARDPRATPICGNGIVEITEQCDDGEHNSNVVPDACRTDCRANRCGDGVVDAGEECDGQAYCTRACKINRRTLPAPRPQPSVCLSTNLQHPIRLPATCPRARALNLNTPANVQYNPTPVVLFNTGEQLVFPVLNGGTFNYRGISYALQRITFVSPSEHYIGNKQFAFEAQLHHQSQDPFNPRSAIVSVLFDVGTSPNAFLQNILTCLPVSSAFQCGNGVKELQPLPDGRLGMEECDNGAQNSDSIPNRCRTNCRNPYCGDGVIDCKEFCDQGLLNANLPNRCRVNCVHPYCGDGIVDTLFGEECDDGNNKNGDGCSSLCRNECGNGVLDPNELCDDGVLNSNVNSDACRLNCLLPKCGDNVVDYGEECDTGVMNSDTRPDACRFNCSRPLCGDGVTDPSLGEECDGGVGCDKNCRKLCGNGMLETGELCDAGAGNSDSVPNACRTDCTTARCGDSVIDDGEECDDGPLNTVRCQGCKIACGNGVLETGEECDDGSCNSDTLPNGCRTSCKKSFCGDGVLDNKEECDNGTNNRNAPNTCRLNCKKPVCGDGIVDAGEACDDGNVIDGDKCSSTCQRECGNGRLDPGEACDNGPDNSDTLPSCCRTTCQLPICGDGVVDVGEECDDGAGLNTNSPNACRPNCRLPTCGDGIVDHLFGEICDQGARNGPFVVDGCSPLCVPNVAGQCTNFSLSLNPQSLLPTTAGTYWYPISGSFPSCSQPGDVFVFAAPQSITRSQLTQFARSNLVGKGKCLQPRNGRNIEFFEVTTVCGDGIVEGDEECDDGPLNSDFAPNACRRTCRRAFCGDGVQDKNEQCDGTPNCGKDCRLSCPTAASLCSTTNPGACPNQSSSNPTTTSVLNNQGTIINVNFESILAQ